MSYDPKESKLVWHHNPAEGPIGKLVEVQNTDDGVSFKFQKSLKDIANRGFSNMDSELIKEFLQKPHDAVADAEKFRYFGEAFCEGLTKGLQEPVFIRMPDSFNAATEALTRYYQEYCDNDVLATKEMYPKYKEEKMNKSGKINITDERDGLVEFGDLITPSVFCLLDDPEPCMKMEDIEIGDSGREVTINAVSLISGVTYNFQEDSLVIPLDCDIKIKEKKV